MSTLNRPHFRLQKTYSDGIQEEPKLYRIDDINSNWSMKRRGFLATTAVGVATLVGISRLPQQVVASDELLIAPSTEGISAHKGFESLTVSPDGKFLASAGGTDGLIKFWEIPSGRLLKTFDTDIEPIVNDLCFSPDGKVLISGGIHQSNIILWEVPSGKELKRLGISSNFSLSPNGKLLATCASNIIFWDLSTGRILRSFSEGECVFTFNPEGNILASTEKSKITWKERNKIKFWEIPSLHLVDTLEVNLSYPLDRLVYSPDGRYLVLGSNEGQSSLLEISSEELVDLEGHSPSFTPDGKLMTSIKDSEVTLREFPSGNLIATLSHKKTVRSASLTPDGKFVLSGDEAGAIKLWEIPSGKFLTNLFDAAELPKEQDVITYTLENQDGQRISYLASCGSPMPKDALCTCNCVSGGSKVKGRPPLFLGGPSFCTCNTICTCVPIMQK